MEHRKQQPEGRQTQPDTSPVPGGGELVEPRTAPVHVSFLIDRSGSMHGLEGDVVGSFNVFAAEQRGRPGECTLTLIQFDSEDPFELVHDAVPVREVPALTVERYRPRGATPLLDALGRLVERADARLRGVDGEEDQIVAVFTDGLENASRRWSRKRLFDAITERKRRGWTFVFMGANQDSYAEAGRLGFDDGSVQDFRADGQGVRAAFGSFSRAVGEHRGAGYRERLRRKRDFFAGRKEAEADAVERVRADDDNRSLLRNLVGRQQLLLTVGDIFERPAPFRAGSVAWSRVRGMMLGLAIGDALGNTTESQLPSRRRREFGEIRDYVPNRHAEGRAVGLPSDDTQLAFWTLEHLVECRGLRPERLASLFASRRIFGIGSAVAEFQSGMRAGRPWWEASARSAGNGALMRIAPVTVPHLATADPAFWSDAALCGAVTHNDAGSIGACVAFAGMLGELLARERPPAREWWVGRFVDLARCVEGDDTRYATRGGECVGYRGPVWRFVQEQVPVRAARPETVVQAGNAWFSGAYLLETVPTVLLILTRYGDDPEEAIVRAVNDAKDNDTVAAIVGAAIGALHGEAALPERWRSGLLGRTGAADDGRVWELLDRAEALFGQGHDDSHHRGE